MLRVGAVALPEEPESCILVLEVGDGTQFWGGLKIMQQMYIWQMAIFGGIFPGKNSEIVFGISDTVGGRNPKQPPGMYKTL